MTSQSLKGALEDEQRALEKKVARREHRKQRRILRGNEYDNVVERGRVVLCTRDPLSPEQKQPNSFEPKSSAQNGWGGFEGRCTLDRCCGCAEGGTILQIDPQHCLVLSHKRMLPRFRLRKPALRFLKQTRDTIPQNGVVNFIMHADTYTL
jgi:hypothetical protein